MKPVFYIIIILVALVSCTRSNEEKEKNLSSISFLSREDGQVAILDETFEPYFSQLQIREIETFIQKKIATTDLNEARKIARKNFSSAVINFTESEKECISFVAQQVDQTLRKNNILLVANFPWKFIKIENWLCGGFAHTRGNYIILSQKHIDYLSKGWNKDMSPKDKITLIKKLGALLVHEKTHGLQRKYKAIFDSFYEKEWGFVKTKVKSENSIIKNKISNPDAPIPEWVIPDNKELNLYYWIRTLLRPTTDIPAMGRDFVDVVFKVDYKDGLYTIRRNEKQEPVTISMEQFTTFTDSFPVKRGLDHPNEIFAYMFADYFVDLVTKREPFSDSSKKMTKNVTAFLTWVNRELTVDSK